MITDEYDDRYWKEFRDLDALCTTFQVAYNAAKSGASATSLDDDLLFLTGQITAKCAMIYNLDRPAGYLHPAQLFQPPIDNRS